MNLRSLDHGQVIKTMALTREQKNWAIVRTIAGYHRYDTTRERELLNQIWEQQSMITNFFLPEPKIDQ